MLMKRKQKLKKDLGRKVPIMEYLEKKIKNHLKQLIL